MNVPGETRRILVVDDDPTIGRLVEGVLSSQGYHVSVAQDAPTGLELAMKTAPALIILDVMMPIINGFNICRLMKNEAHCRNIPIVLLTSRADDEDRKIGDEVGANAYISKPFDTQQLLQVVTELINDSIS